MTVPPNGVIFRPRCVMAYSMVGGFLTPLHPNAMLVILASFRWTAVGMMSLGFVIDNWTFDMTRVWLCPLRKGNYWKWGCSAPFCPRTVLRCGNMFRSRLKNIISLGWLMNGQFYLTEADIGKPRAAASVSKLAELNRYVTVSCILLSVACYLLCFFACKILRSGGARDACLILWTPTLSF